MAVQNAENGVVWVGHSTSPFDRVNTALLFNFNRNCSYLVSFSKYSELYVESRRFQPIPRIWRSRWRWPRWNFPKIFEIRKLESMWLCLRDPMFSRFSWTPTYNTQRDWHRHTHWINRFIIQTQGYSASIWRRAVKKLKLLDSTWL